MIDKSEIEKMSAKDVAECLAHEKDADVILYNGILTRQKDRELITECIERRKRENVILILVSPGGEADPAYRIARCLQQKYKHFSMYVSGLCKSAGTLVALGAHELIISDHGELGPLDVQMSKKDEIWETQSGLTVMAALTSLNDKAFNAFEQFMLETKKRSGGAVTMKTAAEIATNLVSSLFGPMYDHIDPLHVGEAGRAMSIADHYGRRLVINSRNATEEMLSFLLSEYPSHGFVIDRNEASLLFVNVREPDLLERALAEKIGDAARWPTKYGDDATIDFLSSEPPEANSEEEPGIHKGKGGTDGQIKPAQRREAEPVVEDAGEQPAPGDKRHSASNVTPIVGDTRAGE